MHIDFKFLIILIRFISQLKLFTIFIDNNIIITASYINLETFIILIESFFQMISDKWSIAILIREIHARFLDTTSLKTLIPMLRRKRLTIVWGLNVFRADNAKSLLSLRNPQKTVITRQFLEKPSFTLAHRNLYFSSLYIRDSKSNSI